MVIISKRYAMPPKKDNLISLACEYPRQPVFWLAHAQANTTDTPFSDKALTQPRSVSPSTTIVFASATSPITNDDAVFIFPATPDNRLGGSAGKCTFDARLFEISGRQPCFRMDTGHAHKEQIRMNVFDSFDGRRADGDNRVFIQTAADQNHLNKRMINKPRAMLGLCVTTVIRRSRGKRRAMLRWSFHRQRSPPPEEISCAPSAPPFFWHPF